MKHSQKFLQRRRFVMVLPLLVLPFLTVIFWALGGGNGTPAQAMPTEKAGLNLELPSAHFNDDEEWNKLTLYERAERDSMKFREAQESDPYFDLSALVEQEQQEPVKQKENQLTTGGTRSQRAIKKNTIVDPNEAKVNQKLEQLYQELNKTQESNLVPTDEETDMQTTSDPQFSSDVKQLENMMEMMNNEEREDPEMQQIEGMLEKILDIQHPDRVREKIKEQSEQKKGQVFPVEVMKEEENISLLNQSHRVNSLPMDSIALLSSFTMANTQQNSFYGLDDEPTDESGAGNAIEAVVHDTQELVAGSTVKMRLVNDVYINGRLISKGSFVYGTAEINGERLAITINSIRDNNSLFPVSLSAYDLDGVEGIYIPGAIGRDVAKQSSDQALQSLQFMSMDQSLGAQAASAGIQAAQGLFSKKVKLVKVTVKAGYQILLKDKQ
jgi:conjugative transposon TraM protein